MAGIRGSAVRGTLRPRRWDSSHDVLQFERRDGIRDERSIMTKCYIQLLHCLYRCSMKVAVHRKISLLQRRVSRLPVMTMAEGSEPARRRFYGANSQYTHNRNAVSSPEKDGPPREGRTFIGRTRRVAVDIGPVLVEVSQGSTLERQRQLQPTRGLDLPQAPARWAQSVADSAPKSS